MFVERDAELTAMRALVGRAAEGAGGVALIEAAPGLGKTSLLAAVTELAEWAGLRVLRARGGVLETQACHGVARQLLRARLDGPGPGHGASPDEADAALFAILARTAGERPAALVVDDAHLADEPSLRWLLYVARRADSLPLAVVVAGFETDPAGTRGQMIAALRNEPATLALSPGPLTAEGVRELLRGVPAVDATPELTDGLLHATGGNPGLLSELLAVAPPGSLAAILGGDAMPPRLAAMLPGRVARLGRSALKVARTAAIAGPAAGIGVVAALAGGDPHDVATTVDALIAIGVLRLDGGITFAQPIVGEALYQGAPPAERSLVHARMAAALARAAAPARATADHLVAAGPVNEDWAARVLREAARAALEGGQPGRAAVYLGRSLAEPWSEAERPSVLLELGAAEQLACAHGALEHLREALRRVESPEERAAAALELMRGLFLQDRGAEAMVVADDVLADADALAPMAVALLEVKRFAAGLTTAEDGGAARRAARRGTTPPELAAEAAAELLAARRPGAMRTARAALADGRLVAAAATDTTSLMLACLTLAAGDALDEALTHVDAAVLHARTRGSVAALGATLCARAHLHLVRGELDGAERDACAVGDGPALLRGVAAMLAAHAAIERGDLRAAEADLDSASDGLTPGGTAEALVRQARARLASEQGRPAEALTQLDRPSPGPLPLSIAWQCDRAGALASTGDRAASARVAGHALTDARRLGTARFVARALRAVAASAGRDRAIALLREADALLADSDASLERARTLLALGSALRRRGRRRAARGPLREAADLAERCGAAPLVVLAQAEAIAAGARPRRVALRGPASLTPSERRVADLAAAGRSNREIAGELTVTINTVESHLAHVYRKLGIRSRADLRVALSG